MVEFKDVSVTYSSGVDALNKVNLKINDGKVPEHNNGGKLSVFVAAEHKPMRKKS